MTSLMQFSTLSTPTKEAQDRVKTKEECQIDVKCFRFSSPWKAWRQWKKWCRMQILRGRTSPFGRSDNRQKGNGQEGFGRDAKCGTNYTEH
jgi:hypothetical protein